jgi:hypothetical protein
MKKFHDSRALPVSPTLNRQRAQDGMASLVFPKAPKIQEIKGVLIHSKGNKVKPISLQSGYFCQNDHETPSLPSLGAATHSGYNPCGLRFAVYTQNFPSRVEPRKTYGHGLVAIRGG